MSMLVFKNQPCTAQKLLIRHGTPGMFFLTDTGHIPCPFYQITAEGINPKTRNLIDKVTAVFPGVKPVHFIRMVCNINIGFVIPVIDATVATADVLRNRHGWKKRRRSRRHPS